MQYSGTNTLQPYVSKVILEQLSDKQTKVIVRVALKNNSMLDSDLRDAMRTSIVKVSDSKIIKKLSRNNKNTNIELIENARKSGKFGNLDLSIAEVKVLPRHFKEEEKGYHIAATEFTINQNTRALTFYIVCQYDIDHPRYSKMISSRNFKRKIYNDASIVAEDVIRAGKLVKKSKAFVYNDTKEIEDKQRDYSIIRGNKRIWTGPVHYYSKNNPRLDGYVGYVTYSLTTYHNTPKLKLVNFPNATIHDYRVLEKISRIPFNCQISENRPLAHKRNAYFSNLCITNDRDGLVKMFFAVDVGEIIKNNIKIPRFISTAAGNSIDLDPTRTSFEDVMKLSIFKNLSITRQRVKSSGELLEGGAEDFVEKVVESTQMGLNLSNSVNAALSVDNDDENNIEIKALGTIREVDSLFIDSIYGKRFSNNIRFFTISDLSMLDKKNGIYKYGVNLDIEDGSIAYLKELHKSLKLGLKAMEVYYTSFADKYILSADYYQNNQGPWVWALNSLIKVIKSFDDKSEQLIPGGLEEKLYILASPTTCTIESLSKVVKIYEKVTSKIQHIVEELPTRSKRDVENMNPDSVISGNRAFPQIIKIEHTFSDFYEPDGGSDSGYEYLLSSGINTPGLLTVSNQQFLSRISQETLRFFNQRSVQQLSPLEYSYLTPITLKLQDKTFQTYNSDQTGLPTNNTELANFNALVNLYNYKKHGKTITETKQTSIDIEITKTNECALDSLYSQQLNSFSTHVKNNLSTTMSDINVIGLRKYDSPCYDSTEKQEAEYAKLMMPTNTSNKYKSEISATSVRDARGEEEMVGSINLSSVFAPLFYMKHLNISKDLCCFIEKINNIETLMLPNQLKAMTLSNKGVTRHTWYDASGKSSLKSLNNAAFHYLNNKNLVVVEVLKGFAQGKIKAPIWVELREAYVMAAAAAEKTTLLCRLRPYINEALCFMRNELLNLNIFNQCFLLEVAKVPVAPTRPFRRTQPINKLTSLDKNDFLKLESSFMRTNLIFGQVNKQIAKSQKTKGKQKIAASTQGPTITTTSSPMGTTGGTSGGGSY